MDRPQADVQRLTFDPAFLSEVFHELSQPLTALHCSLELSLRRDQSVDELRSSIQAALENAERLRQRLVFMRGLKETFDLGGSNQIDDLRELLCELRDDMLPLFEAATRGFEVAPGDQPITVRGERGRLMRGLFYFVEYLFRYAPEKSTTVIEARVAHGRAELRISSQSRLPVAHLDGRSADPYSCELEMVRQTFRAAGGDFERISGDACHHVWLATLPLG